MNDLAQAFAVALAVDPALITDPMLRARHLALRKWALVSRELHTAQQVASAAQTRVERLAADREVKRLEAQCHQLGDRVMQLYASASAAEMTGGSGARN
jgi:hypothetical protein